VSAKNVSWRPRNKENKETKKDVFGRTFLGELFKKREQETKEKYFLA
jgi:hypothetical protein